MGSRWGSVGGSLRQQAERLAPGGDSGGEFDAAARRLPVRVGGLGLDAQAGLFLTQHFEEGRCSLASLEAWVARFIAHARACQGLLAQARRATAGAAA